MYIRVVYILYIVYIVYMIYNIAEFRRGMREAFDVADTMPVFIKRHDKVYMLRLTPHDKVPVVELDTTEISSNIRPDIKNNSLADANFTVTEILGPSITLASTPVGENRFFGGELNAMANTDEFDVAVEAGVSLPKCCTLKKPCQHWQWNEDEWINSISGESKDAE